jgi:alpha-L-fucosidase 2
MRSVVKCVAVVAMAAMVVWSSAGQSGGAVTAGEKLPELSLWYTGPARQWTEALPVGNGHMGAMVFGGVGSERIQFNHDTLWAGEPRSYERAGAAEVLPEIRRLLFAGKQKEAQVLAMERFMSEPLRQMPYQPMGDLVLKFEGHEKPADYRRWLNLETAEAGVQYRIGEVTYTRRVIASYPDGVIAVRIEADRPGSVTFKAELQSPHQAVTMRRIDARTVAMNGKVNDLVREGSRDQPVKEERFRSVMTFDARLRATATGGKVEAKDGHLVITAADSATIVLAAATNFVAYNDVTGDPAARAAARLTAASKRDWAALRQAHVADYQALFGRVSLKLGGASDAADAADVAGSRKPTDQRLAEQAQRPEAAFAALVFQYGRYLLISSSRPGSQPANLQGVWNDSLSPPWDSKYTTNINVQMNYWPAEVANLAECTGPLFDAIDDLAVTGAATAKAHYNAGGWVVHHNFDLWRGAAPINHSDHGIWTTGGAWLAQHLWWRYEHGGDEKFLRERAYPRMKGAAEFFLDTLVEDPVHGKGWLVSGPSNSPEHGGLVMGPAMDHQIIRYLLGATAEAAEILKVDSEFAARCRETAGRIAPDRVGQLGALAEWTYKENPKTNHRHLSHLWALHPGGTITPETPELFEAARQSLILRGEGGTGWSMAWKISCWAKLLDGEQAGKMVGLFLRSTDDGGAMLPNLFDSCPPFQIDGNFGLTGGIAEMLMQSHRRDEEGRYIIEVLPAIPSSWASGSVTGLRARGGFAVDIAWKPGAAVKVVIESERGGTVVVRYHQREQVVTLRAGQRIDVTW